MGTLLVFHWPGSPQPLTMSPHWQHMHWELQLRRGMGRAEHGHWSHDYSGCFHSPPQALWLLEGEFPHPQPAACPKPLSSAEFHLMRVIHQSQRIYPPGE